MLARKCDRCGKLYEPKDITIKSDKINAILTIQLGDSRKYDACDFYDLCPDCLGEFKNWLLNGEEAKD